ncbi:hypothetical protein, partial [Pseudomonas umsongensis]|uniref:hypothetical protein n=1 Tax=Pseudomonas umsongensis TaxID=198618 RepID=UPI00200A1F43
ARCVFNQDTTAKLIHNCWDKNQQSALGQFSIGRVGQFSISANRAKTMKDIVITVVNFFAWAGIIVATVVGYFAMKGTYEYIGALIGFAAGCLGSGVWFVLSAIHQNIQTIRDIAIKHSQG